MLVYISHTGLPRTALAGGLGGVCLWVAIFPADVVKSRIQVLSIDGSNHTFRSVSRNILKHEGNVAHLMIVLSLV